MVEVAYMATIKLGRLEEVDVRKLWSHEQYDFSNWLAKEENIELLFRMLFVIRTTMLWCLIR